MTAITDLDECIRVLAAALGYPHGPPPPAAPRMTRAEAAALGRQSRAGARAERAGLAAAMRLWPGPGSVPLPGYITSRQAAQRLGVSRRTVERYRAGLRQAAP